MKFCIFLLLFVITIGTAALAQDTSDERLSVVAESQSWDAVGLLNIGNISFCTGALIAHDLVLTAAHCLFDKQTGLEIDHTSIEFLAGWHEGYASAYRYIFRVLIHPEYKFGGDVTSRLVLNDLALLELNHPIPVGEILPFEMAHSPPRGSKVIMVSHSFRHSDGPYLQNLCKVLEQQNTGLVTSCAVDFGNSGAPIFVVQNGEPKIVSVVSHKATVEGAAVSLGTSFNVPLDVLRSEWAEIRTYRENRARMEHVRRGLEAKFIKP